MEAKLSEAGLRFGARFQLEMQRETAKARAAVDEAVREMQAPPCCAAAEPRGNS